jgi:hypothetical protein
MPKFKKHIQKAREKYAIHLLSKNENLSDRALNQSMKAKFGHALHYKTAKVLREEAKKQSTKANDSWKDNQAVVTKSEEPEVKRRVARTHKWSGDLESSGIDPTAPGVEEIKNLTYELTKVMKTSPISSVEIFEENGRYRLLLGVKRIVKSELSDAPRIEA